MPKKRALQKLFYPDFSTVITLTCLAAATPLAVLAEIRVGFFIPYAAYLLALYVLTVLFLRLPDLFRGHREQNGAPLRAWLSGAVPRAKLALLFGTLANLVYAAFRLVAGAAYRSFWFAAEAIYYIILSLNRFLLSSKEQEAKDADSAGARLEAEWEGYRRTAKLLFLLDISLAGIVLSVLLQKQEKLYPDYILGLSAVYTLSRVALSVYQIFRFRLEERLALLSAKALSLSATFLSLFTLQVTLLPRLLPGALAPVFNAVTGVAAFAGVLAIGIVMLRKEKRRET